MLLGLVGHPIAASLSPVMHEAALRHRSLMGSYARFDTTDPAELTAIFACLRRGELDGLNVTVPHKLAAYAACDRLSPVATEVGAVNTLIRGHDGALVGWNSDLPGLVAALYAAWSEPVDGVALVVGAGGAAPAAMLAAREVGAREVRVWNRTAARAAALVERLGFGVAVADPIVAASGASLVIQASSHGMGLTGDALAAAEHEAARFVERTARDAHVLDLIYRPRLTAWVRAATQLGRTSADGLEMLVQQAALSFELWTRARTEVLATSRAASDLLDVMRSAACASAAAWSQTDAINR